MRPGPPPGRTRARSGARLAHVNDAFARRCGALMVLGLLLSGCSSSSDQPTDAQSPQSATSSSQGSASMPSEPAAGTTVTVSELPSAITAKIGDTISVVLEANPTTGYEWSTKVVNPASGPVVEQVGEPQYTPGPSKMPGAGGQTTTILKVVGAGKATVQFTYARPWDPKDDPTVADLQITVSG